jgi:hypothetical protein
MKSADKKTDNVVALTEILQLDLSSCEVQICMASLAVNEGPPDFERVAISTDLAGEFRKIVEGVFARRRKDLGSGDLVVHSYDPMTKLDSHEVERLDLSTHESVGSQIVTLADIEELDTFSGEAAFIAGLRFYVIIVRPTKDTPVYCFRAYSPKRELAQSRLFAMVFRDGHYDSFRDSLFLFDQHIDCVCRGDDLFIFSKDKFQKIFQFYELLLQAAKDTLDVIKARVPIDNFDDFKQSCQGHLLKVAKLKNIASKPYLEKVTMRDIKKVIKKYNLQIGTVGKGKNEKIHFDSSDRWAILRLLDDDYLESVMTGENYEVNSKRPI